ncbi:MAG: hypothetical protein AAGG01_04245, partial [Planctomycetota bacterium]
AVLGTGAALVSKAQSPGGGSGLSALGTSYDGAPIKTISKGGRVNLAEHVGAEGEYTIFEFTADW